MLNRVIVQGRLTKDPELRHTQEGTAVASFSLAVARDYTREQTDFINVVAWRQTADFAARISPKAAWRL